MSKLPVIPGYKIEKKIGHSDIAEVYLGYQEDSKRKVVIKVLNPELFIDQSISEKFIQVANEDVKFVHPNIANLIEAGKSANHHFIVMEHLPKSLKDKLISREEVADSLEIERGDAEFSSEAPEGNKNETFKMLEILKKIIWALDYAHKNNVIHKNIRPENIRFREDQTPTIVDFFISQLLTPDIMKNLKDKGINIGSPYYSSPEQALRKPVDQKTDIYSLGIVFFEMLTGQLPYHAEEAIAVENQHIMEPIPKLPDNLKVYQPLLERMMEKNPEDRISGGVELVQLIDELIYGLPSPKEDKKEVKKTPTIIQSIEDLESTVKIPKQIPGQQKFTNVPEEEIIKPPLLDFNELKGKTANNKFESRSNDDKKDFYNRISAGRTQSPSDLLSIISNPRAIFDNKKIFFSIVGGLLALIIIVIFLIINPFSSNESDLIQDKKVQRELSPEEKEAQKLLDQKHQYKLTIVKRLFEKGQYKKAMEKLKEAEAIKSSPDSKKMAKDINKKIEEQKDHDAFNQAISTKSSKAIAEYMKLFPSGFHIKEAQVKLKEFEKAEKIRLAQRMKILNAAVRLRSEPIDLSIDDAKQMLIKYGFFEKYYNKSGDFENHYEPEIVNNEKIIKDLSTLLIWHPSGSENYMSFTEAQNWVKQLNQKGYGGLKNWRLPTLEEAASLLEKKESNVGLFINPIFLSEQKYIWTCDRFTGNKVWAIDFFSGDFSRVDLKYNVFVKPVHSLEGYQ